MTDYPGPLLRLRPRTYRWVDRVTKILGVGLVAAGLDAGGATTAGLGLAGIGAALGLATVCIDTAESTDHTS
jgi:hypothetical protein